jgi:hypothetical protein
MTSDLIDMRNMKRIRMLSLNYKFHFFFFLLFLLSAITPSCKSTDSDSKTGKTGAITARLVWNTEPQISRGFLHNTPQFSTLPASVTTIRGIISGDDMTSIQQDNNVADGSGKINNIPVGNNRTLVLRGLNSASEILYQGSASSISIQTDQITNAGDISMNPTSGIIDFEDGQVPSSFSMSGDVEWGINSEVPSGGGNYSLKSGSINSAQSSCFSISADTSSGTLEFYAKTDSSGNLFFYVDDVMTDLNISLGGATEYSSLGPNIDWSMWSNVVATGYHVFKWCNLAGFAWIDNIYIPGTIDENPNSVIYNFENGAMPTVFSFFGADWTVDSVSNKFGSSYSALIGGDGTGESCIILTGTTTAGTLSYYLELQNSTPLFVYIDGTNAQGDGASLGGPRSWGIDSYTITSGTHEFKWCATGTEVRIDDISLPSFTSSRAEAY